MALDWRGVGQPVRVVSDEATRHAFRAVLSDQAVVLSGAQYVSASLRIVTTVVAARYLGPLGYGTAALAMTYPLLLWAFLSPKATNLTTRYIAIFRAQRRTEELRGVVVAGLGIDTAVASLCLVILLLSGDWVARSVYRAAEVSGIMKVFGVIFLAWALTGTIWAVLTSWEALKVAAGLLVLESVVALLVVSVALFRGWGIMGVVLGTAVGPGIGALAGLYAMTRLMRADGFGEWWRGRLSSIGSLRAEASSLLGWNFLGATLAGLVAHVPVILVGHTRGAAEAGQYRLAASIVTVASYAQASLARVAYPTLSILASGARQSDLRGLVATWTRTRGLTAAALLIVLLPSLPYVLNFVLGAIYMPAVLPAQILLAAAAVSVLVYWLQPYYFARGRVRDWTVARAAQACLMLTLGWVGALTWGVPGMAAAAAVAEILVTGVLVARFRSLAHGTPLS